MAVDPSQMAMTDMSQGSSAAGQQLGQSPVSGATPGAGNPAPQPPPTPNAPDPAALMSLKMNRKKNAANKKMKAKGARGRRTKKGRTARKRK